MCNECGAARFKLVVPNTATHLCLSVSRVEDQDVRAEEVHSPSWKGRIRGVRLSESAMVAAVHHLDQRESLCRHCLLINLFQIQTLFLHKF